MFDPSVGTARKVSDFEPGLNTRPNDGRVDRAGNFVIGSYNNAHRCGASGRLGLWVLDAASSEVDQVHQADLTASRAIRSCIQPN